MQSLNLEFRHVQMCKFVVFLRTIINHLYLYRSHQLKSTWIDWSWLDGYPVLPRHQPIHYPIASPCCSLYVTIHQLSSSCFLVAFYKNIVPSHLLLTCGFCDHYFPQLDEDYCIWCKRYMDNPLDVILPKVSPLVQQVTGVVLLDLVGLHARSRRRRASLVGPPGCLEKLVASVGDAVAKRSVSF